MLKIRPSHERGHANHGWLDTYHTFSFAHYYHPDEMGYSCLRVINDDTVAPGQGFGAHGHDNMEIVSIVLEGSLEHKDSMGNTTRIRPGDIQRMSAGSGVTHSEYNPSTTEPVHFFQIWILPDQRNLTPSYAQKTFPESERRATLRLVCSPDGRDGSLVIHQDAYLYVSVLKDGEKATHAPAPGRRAYLHVARGNVLVNGQSLGTGDGARIEGEPEIRLESSDSAELLLFDLP